MKMLRRGILLQLSLAIVFFLCVRAGYRQWKFEAVLKAVTIRFEDWPESYATALRKAGAESFDADYDFKDFPEDTRHAIPRLIHFIWFKDLYKDASRPSQIPTQGSEAPDQCREHNPTFKVKIWNSTEARDMIDTHYPWFIPTYDQYRYPIQRVDAFKYFLLHHVGGIYMDMDITCRRDMTPLLFPPAWFPKAKPFGVNNDLMAARARHPLMARMIDGLMPRDVNLLSPWLTIFFSTGPQFASDLVKRWYSNLGWRYENVRQPPGDARPPLTDKDSVWVLPDEFYSEQYTFFGHSPGGTWYENDVFVVLWIIERIKTVTLILVAVILGLVMFSQRKRLRLFRRNRGPQYMPIA